MQLLRGQVTCERLSSWLRGLITYQTYEIFLTNCLSAFTDHLHAFCKFTVLRLNSLQSTPQLLTWFSNLPPISTRAAAVRVDSSD